MRLAALVIVLALLLVGCSEGDPGADGDVESLGDLVPAPLADELTETGRCDDDRLWASDDSGTLSVVVDPGPVDEATLPTEEVEVRAVQGSDPCAATEGSEAVAGRVEVEGCALTIDGLETSDGTTFGPIEIEAIC